MDIDDLSLISVLMEKREVLYFGLSNTKFDESCLTINKKFSDAWKAINIFSVHLSCKSLDPMEWKKSNVGGIVFYQKYIDAEKNLKIQPGYIII